MVLRIWETKVLGRKKKCVEESSLFPTAFFLRTLLFLFDCLFSNLLTGLEGAAILLSKEVKMEFEAPMKQKGRS